MITFLRFLVGFSKVAIPLFALYMGMFHSGHVAKHASILMHVIPLIVLMATIEISVLWHDHQNSSEAD